MSDWVNVRNTIPSEEASNQVYISFLTSSNLFID